ncbi:L,D-transpeptidase family protein [Entomobacter blattae]|nr:L,D-transpeptidase [Entomobacter blattae]
MPLHIRNDQYPYNFIKNLMRVSSIGLLVLVYGHGYGRAAIETAHSEISSHNEEDRKESQKDFHKKQENAGLKAASTSEKVAEAKPAFSPDPLEGGSAPVEIPPLPSLGEKEAEIEAVHLAKQMRHDIPHFKAYSSSQKQHWIAMAKAMIKATQTPIERPQILTVVDRNPHAQALAFILAQPEGSWLVLGGTHVSTGQSGRKYYYITPTGVFHNTTERLGYRALGTKNENGVRGIGLKGMRVWDMGWQWAEKGWLSSREKGQIRLEIHATDPALLEWKIGHPASEGCIRLPTAVNVFMDKHGLIDVLYEQAASYDIRFRALLPKDRIPSLIAGDALVVVDSAEHVQQPTYEDHV